MKKLSIIPFILMSLVALPSWGETKDDLVERDGIYYKKFTDEPFTGELTGQYQGRFENGLRKGPWVFYHDNGQLAEKGEYNKTGELDGFWVRYGEDGQVIERSNYKNGILDGPYVFIDGENHIITNYRNNLEDGRYQYFVNGQLSEKGEYKNGKKDGHWVHYHENGQLESKGSYKIDERHDRWVFYDADGNLNTKRSGVYKNGVKIGDVALSETAERFLDFRVVSCRNSLGGATTELGVKNRNERTIDKVVIDYNVFDGNNKIFTSKGSFFSGIRQGKTVVDRGLFIDSISCNEISSIEVVSAECRFAGEKTDFDCFDAIRPRSGALRIRK